MKKLKRDFFDRSTLLVAQELLGKVLVFKDMRGIITETEAYCGFDDPASHAARGRTERTKLMFGKPGISYVYLIYGMYNCLNVVTECEEYPAAVLIRAIQIFKEVGKNTYKKTRNNNERYFFETEPKLNGPGKLCRFLGITRAENGIDMINSPELYIADANIKLDFLSTPRIGISAGQDKHWRYVVKGTEGVKS